MKNLKLKCREIEKSCDFLTNELTLAANSIFDDPKNTLTKARIVLEMIVYQLYRIELKGEPLGKKGGRKSLGDILMDKEFQSIMDERMCSRMFLVKNFGNMGPHPKKEDTLINAKDAWLVLDTIADITIWYMEKYQGKHGFSQSIEGRIQNYSEVYNLESIELLQKEILDLDIDDVDNADEVDRVIDRDIILSPNLEDTVQHDILLKNFPILEKYQKLAQVNITNEIKLNKISYAEIEKVVNIYINMPYYEDAKSVLYSHHLLILKSNKKSGRFTSAIHLLQNVGVEQIVEICVSDIVPEPGLLNYLDFSPNTGYILQNYSFSVDSPIIEELAYRMKGMNSYLVFTTSDNDISEGLLDAYCVPCPMPKDRFGMLINNIWYQARTQQEFETIKDIIDNPDFRRFTYHNLLYPYEIDYIIKKATTYKDWYHIEDYFPSGVQLQIKKWFQEQHTLDDTCLFIALALFNKSGYSLVIEAANHLKNFMLEYYPDIIATGGLDLSKTKEQILDKIRAKSFLSSRNTEYGMITEECIAFKNEEYPGAILEYIQLQAHNLYKPLIVWLKSYLSNNRRKLGDKIPAIVAYMAKNDFEIIKDEFIQEWAVSRDYYLRLMVAGVLDILSRDKDVVEKIHSLIHHWASLGNNRYLGWIAAFAYGNTLGINYPKSAVKDLYYMLTCSHLNLYRTISISLQKLFRYGYFDNRFYRYVLHTLLLWIQDAEEHRKQAQGIDVFLDLCSISINAGDQSERIWVIMDAMKSSQLRQDYLTPLIVYALKNVHTRIKTKDTLKSWFIQAEKNEEIKMILIRLILGVYNISDPYNKMRLFKLIQELAQAKEPGNKIAADTLQYFIY